MFKRLFSVLAVLALTACAAVAPPQPRTAETYAAATRVEHDQFQQVTRYQAPTINSNGSDVALRSFTMHKSSETIYQIYFIASYGGKGWRFYNSIYDVNGNRLDTTLISRDVGHCSKYGCSHYEHLAANVTRDYLEKVAQSGMSMKLVGQAGSEVHTIPPEYVRGFLAATARR